MTEHRRLVALLTTRGKSPEEVAAELVRRLRAGDRPASEGIEEEQRAEQSGHRSE